MRNLECLKPAGFLLLAEPPLHVSKRKFDGEVALAEEVGFQIVERPRLGWSRSVVLAKSGKNAK